MDKDGEKLLNTWDEWRRSVLENIKDLKDAVKSLEDDISLIKQQNAFWRGAVAVLAFLSGSGIATTIVILLVKS
jgi:hypothetical protein